MSRILLLCLGVFISACMSACMSACVSLHQPMTRLILLSPASFNTELLATNKLALFQTVKIETLDLTTEYTAVLEIDVQAVKVRALNPFGQTLFELSYDGKLLSNDSQIDVDQAHHIMALLMFALWPESALNAAYGRANISDLLQESKGKPLAHKRSLEYYGKQILDVSYDQDMLWSKNIQIEDHINNMVLTIKTLEVME